MNQRIRIQKDLTEAMKARDPVATKALRSLLAAIGNAEAVDVVADPNSGPTGAFVADVRRDELDDTDVARIVAAEVDELREAISTYRRVDRLDMVEAMEAEIEVLSRYVPD
jgi:uncharacterized protein YqeY